MMQKADKYKFEFNSFKLNRYHDLVDKFFFMIFSSIYLYLHWLFLYQAQSIKRIKIQIFLLSFLIKIISIQTKFNKK